MILEVNVFTLKEIVQLKRKGGFNNDWHVAITGACWLRFYGESSFETFAQTIDHHGRGLKAVRGLCPDLDAPYEQRITRLAKEAYGGVSACRRLYGFDPLYFSIPGHWRREKPLPALDKPNPAKLITVAGNLKSNQPVYLGDSRDDLDLVKNYKAVTGDPMDFCHIGEEPAPEGCDLSFRSVNEFLDQWRIQHG